MIKYGLLAVLSALLGALLPYLTRGKPNTTWAVFLLRKPIPVVCFGLSIGFLIFAIISTMRH